MITFLVILLALLILYLLFWLLIATISIVFKLVPFIIAALVIKLLFFSKGGD